jgi:hypothetical protein
MVPQAATNLNETGGSNVPRFSQSLDLLAPSGHQELSQSPGSKVQLINIYRRLDAQFDKIFGKPVSRAFSPLVAKKDEKVPVGVVLACGTP